MCNGKEVPDSLAANSQFCVPVPHFVPRANHRSKVHVYWTRPGRQNEQHVAEALQQIQASHRESLWSIGRLDDLA